jgi:ribosome-associated toxin RatA of RatAB toxin-antitoxin module
MHQSEKSLITGLQVEKKHLQESLNENITLKEQYRDKNVILQEKNEELFKQCELNKRLLVGIEELKQDRDARIT